MEAQSFPRCLSARRSELPEWAPRHESGRRDRHRHRSHVRRHAAAPLTSTLLAVMLIGVDGVIVTPQVVVAVVIAFVITIVSRSGS